MTTGRHVTAIVLAAGMSTRAGARNKLLLPCGTTTMLGRVVSTAVSVCDRTVVVAGFDSDRIRAAVADLGVSVVLNTNHSEGMASSIVCGVRNSGNSDFYLIWPGDMPLVAEETVRILLSKACHGRIAVPRFQARRGHPVVFSAVFRGELQELEGDVGARSILARRPDVVDEIPVSDAGILFDVDTADEHAELLRRL